MFYVLVQLNDYMQVAKIAPSLLQDIRRLIVHGMEAGKCRLQKEHGGALLFRADAEYSSEPTAALRTTMHVYEQLLQQREHLYGFSICFDLANTEDIDRLFRSLYAWQLSLPDDDSFWIGERVAPLVSILELEQRGTQYRVVGKTRKAEPAFNELAGFARMLPVRQRLAASLESHLFGEKPEGSLLVSGSSEHALLRHTLIELEALQGRSDGWVIIPENRGYLNPAIPLLHAMDRSRMDETPGFLVRSERMLWKRLLPLLDVVSEESHVRPIPDRPEQDLSVLFLLYLTAFRRRMEEQLIPPVVILHRPHRYGRDFLSQLSRIIRNISKQGKILSVIVEEKPWHPSSRRFPIAERVTVGLPEYELVRELLEGADHLQEIDRSGVFRLTGRKTVPLFLLLSLLRAGSGNVSELVRIVRTGSDRSADSLYPALLQRLSNREQDYLCIASSAAGILRPEEALRIVEPDLDTADLHGFFRTLASIGLSAPENGADAFTEGSHQLAERFLTDRFLSARDRMTSLLLSLRKRHRFREDRGLLALISESRDPVNAIEPARSLVRDLLNRGLPEEAIRICRPASLIRGLPADERAEWQRIRRAGLFRAALISGDEKRSRILTRNAVSASGEQPADEGPDLRLQLGKFLRKQGSGRDAMANTKKALIGFQERNDVEGECQATIEMGFITLGEGKLLDAADYFAICRKAAEGEILPFEQIASAALEAAALFVYGNYTRSRSLCRSARAGADRVALREWELFLLLLEGRIFFELGKYTAARTIFLRGRSVARTYGFHEAERILQRWSARTILYEGGASTAIGMLRSMEEDPESLLFLAEACIEEKLLHEAESILNRGISLCERRESDRQLQPGEFIEWSSGTASIEDAAMGGGCGDVLIHHMMRVYRGYLLGRDEDPERKIEGMSELHRLTRSDRLSPIDPYNSLYSFLYMSILPETRDPGSDDRVTVLGKAVRYLQERISRIEAYDDRQAYIRNNLWNRRLVTESKRFNLV